MTMTYQTLHAVSDTLVQHQWVPRTVKRTVTALTARAVRTAPVHAGDYTGHLHTPTAAASTHIAAARNERPFREAAIAHLPRDGVLWDIGANIGSWTATLGQRARHVVAVEPAPANVSLLRQTCQTNAVDVTVCPVALAETTGVARFEPDARDEGGAGRGHLDESGSLCLPTRRGDDLRETVPAPDLVKIDVEGAEARVLAGLGDVLGDVRAVAVECHDGTEAAVREHLARFDVREMPGFAQPRLVAVNPGPGGT